MTVRVLYSLGISLVVIVVCIIAMCIIFGVPRLPIRPCDERPPAMYGHFCLVPRVSVHDSWVLLYINDLEEGLTGKILKFADDTKLFRKVKEIGDKQKLQDDIDKLVKWFEKWQMLFNFGKCKCLHTGSGNTGVNYEMGGTILSKTVKEKT